MSPLWAVLRILVRAALVASIVTVLSWCLVECAPGSTAERAAVAARAIAAGDFRTDAESRAQIVESISQRHELGGGLAPRIARNLGGLATLDFGNSWQDARPVRAVLLSRQGLVTVLLSWLALCFALILGLTAGIASARRPRSRSGWALGAYAAIILSIPVPWVAMLVIRSLAYGAPLALFPTGGFASPVDLVLPLLVLASAPVAVIWRHVREQMALEATSPWVLTARARGTSETRLWRVLILRAILPNTLSLVPGLLAYLLAASILVERVFAIPGLGDVLARAAASGDAPILVNMAALTAATISLVSSTVDLAVRRVDPRRGEEQ